ncbi:hypothetical protein PAHAL_8G129000 [Panicum hallii]|uniref:Uncharacterized protein n=1 Tax=Panicum hallii TaxID=206008 RepID=A0A2T8I8Q8_9POAL|nr:hypothetical protein PAHAL_8G129000 [Panicum hallii]
MLLPFSIYFFTVKFSRTHPHPHSRIPSRPHENSYEIPVIGNYICCFPCFFEQIAFHVFSHRHPRQGGDLELASEDC